MTLIKSNSGLIPSSEITPEEVYRSRRHILKAAGLLGAVGAAIPSWALPSDWLDERKLPRTIDLTDEDITDEALTTQYNNFYEFGTDKGDPYKHAEAMTVDPWHIEVGGLVAKPGSYEIESLLKDIDIEERVYRLRCVEAWSAVIPWLGFPVKKLLDKVEPLGAARYVKFTTYLNRDEMQGTRSFFSSIKFPYVEGLRLDEANHDLAIFAVGMYGKLMPKQNGAPFRLVVPWKYGFKSIKSIVKIELTEREPRTTWNISAPHEYGFYSNVNPTVDHPRWSQKTERRLGGGFFAPKIPTLMYNGYSEVAPLYKGMNLRKFY